ncbi:hypothetical protein M758_1G248900 [Ceratodon purpureus]|uniref:Glycosyltransferase family 92 protein n=1 Tax=Ceratodon purpureus TaxID=3225 RepID=A0A8T0JB18_CERPU|nr:hypothetical protein KC19_1G255100 [Ceratodon purpureus]KAG0631379.1 hypothetical protein M758_1G248900 [Ceratodon purpureus]
MKDFKEKAKQGIRETGSVKEKVWSKELGCQAAVRFRMSTCSDVRINVVYALVVACGFFLILAQLLPLRSIDTSKLWCNDSSKALIDVLPLSESFLHENINASAFDTTSKGDLRVFTPHGLATHLFIEMGAYRGSPRVFSIVGLIAKPIESFHAPPYSCEWLSQGRKPIKGKASKTLPDWNYGKLYTVVVITCTFRQDVGVEKEGGELVLSVGYGDQFRQPERFTVLTEKQGEYNATMFNPPYPYDYVYCGSSVYGDVSPQRMREWLAYHAYFLGDRSHFIFHDAGGFHPDVWTVLEPWIKNGRVSVQNIRQQELYDAYYHNQFLVVNDCLFRSRFMANWTFFFDIDEYLHVPPTTSLPAILDANPNITQITFEQVLMSDELCVADNTTVDGHAREWAFEKLVYRKVLKRGVRYDRKYVVQARHATATGVHMSMNMRKGKNLYPKGDRLRYYHYHGAINQRKELCSVFVRPQNKTDVQRHRSQNHRLDETLAMTADLVKDYERQTVGALPFIL